MEPERMKIQQGDALIIVDVQKDFCPGGVLPIPDGDAVIPVLNQWITEARLAGAAIYASRDWHPASHLSFQTQGGPWPSHCIQDTPGAAFHHQLELPDTAEIITKGVRFDKDQNSVFDDTGLAVELRKRGVNRLFVGGLAQDVCVRASVLDALKEGFDVLLIENGMRPVATTDGDIAMKQMTEAGAILVSGAGMAEPAAPDICLKAPEWAEHSRFQDREDACDDGRAGI